MCAVVGNYWGSCSWKYRENRKCITVCQDCESGSW